MNAIFHLKAALCIIGLSFVAQPAYTASGDKSSKFEFIDTMHTSIGYRFKSEPLLNAVFNHPSNDPENLLQYQRLEFSGDSILGFVVSQQLLKLFPTANEGDLTVKRAQIVSNQNNTRIFDLLNIYKHIKCMVHPSGVDKVKADTCEALVGAIYLDGGLDSVQTFILKNWFSQLAPPMHTTPAVASVATVIKPTVNPSARTRLHTLLLKEKKSFEYKVVQYGSTFKATLHIDRKPQSGEFIAATKSAAKELAAQGYLNKLTTGSAPSSAESLSAEVAVVGEEKISAKASSLVASAPSTDKRSTGATQIPAPQVSTASKGKVLTTPILRVKVTCGAYTATFQGNSKKSAKRAAAKEAYEVITKGSIGNNKAVAGLEAHCRSHKLPLPIYIFE